VFVANNGNAEGSVTSFTFSPGGEPQFVAKLITAGAGGTNAYAIALSPSGRILVTTHATAATTERLSFMRVNADATLTPLANFTTPDSPLDAVWTTETSLAVTLTNTSLPNKVIAYRFDEQALSLTEINREDAGAFTAYLELSPDCKAPLRRGLDAEHAPIILRAARRLPVPGVATPTGAYPLDPGFTHDGRRLYAGCGISNGSNKILGFQVNPADGALTPLPQAPYTSPGSSPSPKLAVASTDDKYLFVGHGSSSVVRSFAIDALSGDLTDTGFSFDVGIQGDLGDVAVLGTCCSSPTSSAARPACTPSPSSPTARSLKTARWSVRRAPPPPTSRSGNPLLPSATPTAIRAPRHPSSTSPTSCASSTSTPRAIPTPTAIQARFLPF
jgi:6-phosphogluconolactonase (cycloisomerase 2 family)